MSTTSTPAYKKFPAPGGQPRGFGIIPSKTTVWFAEDHLLLLKRTGFLIDIHESYKRLYFGDIRGVSIERTGAWLWRAVINGVIALALFAFGFWLWSAEPARQYMVYIILGIALVPLCKAVLALMRGPSCVFRIHTAVQMEEVPCLGYLYKAHQFITALRPRIEAAQGDLPVDQILSQVTGQSVAAVAKRSSTPPRIPVKSPAKLWAHQAFYALLLIGAPLEAFTLFSQSSLIIAVNSFLGLIGLVFLVCSVVLQSQGAVAPVLKKFTWGVAVYCGITMLIVMGCQFFFTIQYSLEHPGRQPNQWAMIQEMHHYMVTRVGWYKNAKMVDIGLSVLAGTIGLVLSFAGQPKAEVQSPANPPAP